jgi:hypothetical protein
MAVPHSPTWTTQDKTTLMHILYSKLLIYFDASFVVTRGYKLCNTHYQLFLHQSSQQQGAGHFFLLHSAVPAHHPPVDGNSATHCNLYQIGD